MALIHAALQEFGLETDGLEYGVGAQQWADVLSEAGESAALPDGSAHGVWVQPSSEGLALHFCDVNFVGFVELGGELVECGATG